MVMRHSALFRESLLNKSKSSKRWGWILGLVVLAWYLLSMLVVLR